MKQLILVGPINLEKVPLTGDTMKNQLFLKRFGEVFDKVIPVDTMNWKRRPWVMLKIICAIALYPKANVVVSANPGGADNIIKILNKLHLNKRLYYWVVGGSLHKTFERGNLNVEDYREIKAILVQGKSMEESLKSQGLPQAIYVPNSKYIDFIPEHEPSQDGMLHFVFLSRLERYKGCDDIIAASDLLKKDGYEGKYDITFFGKTTDEKEYSTQFLKAIEKHPEITYRGPLNLRETSNYSELAKYNVMLFPTYWEGEGFPGIVIDAYIAGLPIIASDWNLNRDVIEDGVSGWIIPPHDVEALAERMKYAIDNPEIVAEMSEASSSRAMLYDARNVLSEQALKKIGLL